ncbi:hypothetical protein CNX65_30135 [Actinosynnema pretiosum]|uniref:TIR domain-containing protein n=1 Tax=Actinosynnema pretiosum TaxID=42197 RepID=A0A290ZDH6_9PSEU|nr:hypothetical protein CNX65_30135 [Actinosynnema pretiosum]
MAIVSCDIVGHSAATDDEQLNRVERINEIVGNLIRAHEPGDVFWASGGDGGHVVFLEEDWPLAAVGLVEELHGWAQEEQVSLRITGHFGLVASIHGADGREQLVGSPINYAGWLMSRVKPTGVVVSDAFRERAQPVLGDEWKFHEPWLLPNPDFPEQMLYLLSSDKIDSRWFSLQESDQNGLAESVKKGDAWGVIRYVKRIWQADVNNEQVAGALGAVKRLGGLRSLRDQTVNPFLGYFDDALLEKVVRLGQLVERRAGERVCRFGDTGDSLFVILAGELGVYRSEGKESEEAKPMHRIGKGEVAGELAYALARTRTADLVALTDVSLLSYSNEEINKNLSHSSDGARAREGIDKFITGRVLEHICDNTDYLLGRKPPEDALDEREVWRRSVERLKRHCQLIRKPPGLNHSLEDIRSAEGQRTGIFILVAGQVQDEERGKEVLNSMSFPVLWCELPGLLSTRTRSYRVHEKPVIILRVLEAGIEELSVKQQEVMKKALERELGGQSGEYEYDLFLCHSSKDKPVVLEIYERLRAAGLRVWLDREEVRLGAKSVEAIESGLKKARYLLACVSESFHEARWAKQEVEAMVHLDLDRDNGGSIIPLLLDESVSLEGSLRPFLRDPNRYCYTRDGEFERLVAALLSSR